MSWRHLGRGRTVGSAVILMIEDRSVMLLAEVSLTGARATVGTAVHPPELHFLDCFCI